MIHQIRGKNPTTKKEEAHHEELEKNCKPQIQEQHRKDPKEYGQEGERPRSELLRCGRSLKNQAFNHRN